MNWQPIETAPKQGRILVFNAFFGVYSSEWMVEYKEGHESLPREQREVKWQGYPLGLSSVGFGRWYCTATQWMPLPAAPCQS